VIAGAQLQVVNVEALGVRGRLEDVLALGKHVEHGEIRPAVVVEVGRVDAHREAARMSDRRRDRLGERPIAVVAIEKVVLLEVVRDVEIGAPVEIEVAGDDAQSITFDAAIDTRLLADVDKVIAVISE
jgi:hypothetical protein